MPFAQAIGENHPNGIGEQFYKLTFSPSRAAAAGVSYDFGDPAPILNPFKNGNFVPHVLQKSRFLFCVDSGDFRLWKVCLGTLPWPRESVPWAHFPAPKAMVIQPSKRILLGSLWLASTLGGPKPKCVSLLSPHRAGVARL